MATGTIDLNTFTNVDWANLVLADGGWPQTDANVQSILQWMASENSPATWTGTAGANNPLNNGLGSGGGSGLGSYPDLATAAMYAAQGLQGGIAGATIAVPVLQNSQGPQAFAAAMEDPSNQWASGRYGGGASWYSGTPPTVTAASSMAAGATGGVAGGSSSPNVSTSSSSGGATAGGGQAGAPYVPSIIPGVPAVAPQTPDFTYVPTNEIGRVVSWAFEFGAWGLFITIIFAFGAVLMLLGLAMIMHLFTDPIAKNVLAPLTGATPTGRVAKTATRKATGAAKSIGRAGQATAGAGRTTATAVRNSRDRLSQGGDRKVAQRAADQAPRNHSFANTEAQRRGIPASELRRQNTRPKSKSPERVERRRQGSREAAKRLEKQGYDREPF